LKATFYAQKESEKKVERGVEEESKDDKVEKEAEEKSKDDRKEEGMLCHCGTPAKREVVKKEGKNKGNNKITHPLALS
jgi:hypothetical protein